MRDGAGPPGALEEPMSASRRARGVSDERPARGGRCRGGVTIQCDGERKQPENCDCGFVEPAHPL